MAKRSKVEISSNKIVPKKVLTQEEIKNVPLGTKLRDRVTGFVGIATAKIEFLNGCVQFSLKPSNLDKDGKVYEAQQFDCQQLEYVDEGIAPKAEPKKPTGGNMPDSPRLNSSLM